MKRLALAQAHDITASVEHACAGHAETADAAERTADGEAVALARAQDITASVTRACARLMRRPPTPPSGQQTVMRVCAAHAETADATQLTANGDARVRGSGPL
ncbi:hypothetical protein [Streptomyces sp. NBC_00286]|uniref:hypothetical protein n=1 Tax=Streptomyces sp. NBC_00286 TaxID=2975701 RepID=UPI002E2D64D3|nr:hypothetical protein [Streptomyces sp. NBC_00286]